MDAVLKSNQRSQLQSFWNLIQASDESVQKGLLRLLHTKYPSEKVTVRPARNSFFALKGILKSKGDTSKDQQLLDEYLKDKYEE